VIRVVSVLEQESEDFWVDKVKSLSSRALEVLVRDYKVSIGCSLDSTADEKLLSPETENPKNQNGFPKPQNSPKSLHVQRSGSEIDSNFHPSSLNLSDEALCKLLKLQQKGIDINAMLLYMLNKRATEIEKEKEDLAQHRREI
jgi:hypothetical protein